MVALLLVLVVLTGCGGHAGSGAQAPPIRATPPTPSIPPTSAPATSFDGRAPVSDVARLHCDEPIDELRSPRPEMRTAGGAIALVVVNPQSFAETPQEAPHRRWEKSPLVVRLGRRATVEVPRAWATRLAFTWGTNAQLTPWTTKMVVGPCHEGFGHRPWVVFPGGYSFDRPACVPIRVTAGGRSSVLHVALGRGVTCSAHG